MARGMKKFSKGEGIRLKQNLELSQNNFNEMQLEFGKDIIQKCLGIISPRSDWSLAKTEFEDVLE